MLQKKTLCLSSLRHKGVTRRGCQINSGFWFRSVHMPSGAGARRSNGETGFLCQKPEKLRKIKTHTSNLFFIHAGTNVSIFLKFWRKSQKRACLNKFFMRF